MPETHTQEHAGSTIKGGPVDVAEELEEVRVLRLQPGDVVVCTLRRDASHAEFEEIHARLKERFPDNAVTIVGQDAELSVVRPATERTP